MMGGRSCAGGRRRVEEEERRQWDTLVKENIKCCAVSASGGSS